MEGQSLVSQIRQDIDDSIEYAKRNKIRHIEFNFPVDLKEPEKIIILSELLQRFTNSICHYIRGVAFPICLGDGNINKISIVF